MNVAMLFPLWPGNIGLVQAAVALPLVSYGVPYAKGFAFGIGLQAIEMSVGVGRRPHLPRPRGAVVRDAQAHARRRPGRGAPEASRRRSRSRSSLVRALASPASCKGVLSAVEAAMALAAGMRHGRARGGGAAGGGRRRGNGGGVRGGARRRVAGRRRRAIRSVARFARAILVLEDGTVVVEAAEAVGPALARRGRARPDGASSRGLGELLLAAAAEAGGPILVGLGDTATVDGGAGLLEVVGDELARARAARRCATCAIRCSGSEARRAPSGLRRALLRSRSRSSSERLAADRAAAALRGAAGAGAAGGLGAAIAALGGELASGRRRRLRANRLPGARSRRRPRRDGRGHGRSLELRRKGGRRGRARRARRRACAAPSSADVVDASRRPASRCTRSAAIPAGPRRISSSSESV